MRVVAARFREPQAAWAVLDRLLRHLRRDPDDIEIAPLGTPGKVAASDTVLAGHFTDDEAIEVTELVRAAGGEIVADVDERWTRPWRSSRDATLKRQQGGDGGGGPNA